MCKFTLDTTKRIRLGIWGLGRGMTFYRSCEALGIDVVAGCDYNAHMREAFLKQCPNAFVTANHEEFLKQDMDAVLVATYSTEHCDDTILALEAGKHVLAEVTSFHTMAQGVRLVEAVEKAGLVYQLAENYPFTKRNMFLADQYEKGLFGELQYAEFEYVHNCVTLAYTYIDGVPIAPGNTVHFWRSWVNFHYYNTHSLGPVMNITGLRPTRIVSLPCKPGVPGFLDTECQQIAPSLINMSNGSIMRNFMGATSSDVHTARLWGTLGAAEDTGQGLMLRLGGGISKAASLKLAIDPEWPQGFGELAEQTGHGGGDFWVLYYFAREIREGTAGPFSIYGAAACTSAGILGYRSGVDHGQPYDIPNFANKDDRDIWRNDHFQQKRYDVRKGCFPEDANPELTGKFSATMRDMIVHANTYLALSKWHQVVNSVRECDREHIEKARADYLAHLDEVQGIYKTAREIADAYPSSDGGVLLSDMLQIGGEPNVLAGSFTSF